MEPDNEKTPSYPEVEDFWKLTGEEIRRLKEFFDSPEWRVLHELEKKLIEVARGSVEHSHELPTILRAQGMLEAFRRRDGVVEMIHDQAKAMEKEAEERDR